MIFYLYNFYYVDILCHIREQLQLHFHITETSLENIKSQKIV